jgi:predicted dehydrogenase
LIRVGIVGIGFMGWIHWLAYQKIRGVQVVAISTRDKRRLAGDWRGIQGNFGPPGAQVDLKNIAAYADLDDLLADERIDLVDVTLPTYLHADTATRALRAGKHVLCEKPMALRMSDCNRMVAAANTARSKEQGAGRKGQTTKRNPASQLPAPRPLLFIGHVLPFFPEYNWALKVASSGKYGRVLGGAFRRVIVDPPWAKNFWSAEHIGGPMLDLHIHDAHFIRLLFGMPASVMTQGRVRNGLPAFWHTQFRFADRNLTVEATSGTIDQPGRPFTHGFEIHLERATLAFEFAVFGDDARYLCEPVLLDNKGGVQHPKLAGGDPVDAFVDELSEVARSIRAGRPSKILGAGLAQDAMRICEAQSSSLLREKPVKL